MSQPRYSLQPAGKHRWRAKMSLGRDPATGRYPQRSKIFRAQTKTDARILADEWADGLARSEHLSVVRVDDLVARHIASKKAAGTWKPQTERSFRQHIRHFVERFGSTPLDELTPVDMIDWQNSLRGTPATRQTWVKVAISLLRWAGKAGMIPRSRALELTEAFETIRVPKPRAPRQTDVRRLLAWARAHDPQLFRLLWCAGTTGMRRSELVGLRIGDISGDIIHARGQLGNDGNWVAGLKTEESRTVAIDPVTQLALQEQIEWVIAEVRGALGVDVAPEPDWLVFRSPRTLGPWKPSLASGRVGRASEAAGIETTIINGRKRHGVWLHGLRRTTATLLANANVPATVIRDRIGHTSVEMTDWYTTVLDQSAHEAARIVADELAKVLGEG